MKMCNCPLCWKQLIRLEPYEDGVYKFWCDDCNAEIIGTPKVSPVKVICYGQEKIWDSRSEAIKYYAEAMAMCEGSERERYSNIYSQLIDGCSVCHDE